MISRKRKFKLTILAAWCKGCGLCVDFCPKKVLAMNQGKAVVVDAEACTGCLLCEIYCPDFAIEVHKQNESSGQQ